MLMKKILKPSWLKCSSKKPTNADFDAAKYRLIDFHSHILPGMDDGSSDTATSREMLVRIANDGVRAVVATPHFYGDAEFPEKFLERRTAAAARLASALADDDIPEIYLGAEAAYFPGMGETKALSSLCVAGTNCILIEMPFSRWSEMVWDDLFAVQDRLGLRPVLAHIERYLPYISAADIDRLLQHGIILQSNGEFFTNKKTVRRAIKMLMHAQIRLLGSDSHNLSDRAPNLGDAAMEISSRGAGIYLDNIEYFAASLLEGAEPLIPHPQAAEIGQKDYFNAL